jgi:ABC-type ATPase involved in cell division
MEEKEIENKTLDEETGKKILNIFKTLNQNGITVLIVTHIWKSHRPVKGE